MTTTPQCQAVNRDLCTHPRCPEHKGIRVQIQKAVAEVDFESLAKAKDSQVASFKSVKLPADFRKVVKAIYPDIVFSLSGNGEADSFVVLNLIKLPKEQQRSGTGTRIMTELVAAADKNSWNLALTPSDDFGSSKLRLEVFYRRFGFIMNRGRSRDFSTKEAMVRYS